MRHRLLRPVSEKRMPGKRELNEHQPHHWRAIDRNIPSQARVPALPRVRFWLIRRKRAPEVFKAWLEYPMIYLWDVIINVRLALPGETEPSSNGVDLGRIWRETILS
ncbi:hypothetical protein CA85_33280 [Allorhodopirellula solitaria]|uniref:Uncharacterized protein n=1 Tax=Allorhodopirellula solitaria TaxID=2527987 RepID=A0A5C5XRJ3_9BACT|nr:hypothetical protein CA85_33280 [Allorhodopirellula solitaria]